MIFKPTDYILFSLLFIILLFYSFPGLSQQSAKLDSLLQELKKPEKDTNRVEVLVHASGLLHYTEKPKAKSYAWEALALSTELSYTGGLANASRIMGNIYQSEVLDSALYYYLESLQYYQILDDSLGCIDAYYNIANVYLQLSNFEAAKKNQLLCCELAEKVNNHEYLFRAKNGMGIYYIGLGQYQEENKDSLAALESYREAIPFLSEAAQHAASMDKHSEYYKSQAYGNLAYVKTALGDYDTALTLAMQMLKTYKAYGYTAYYPISYSQIADIYLKLGNYRQSIVYASTSLEWSSETDNLYAMSESYEILYKAHKAMGNYKEAVLFGQQMFDLSRKILNKEREEQIAQMQTKYDTKQIAQENKLLKKEAEIAEISIKKQRVYVVLTSGLMILIVAITLLIYKNLLNKKHFAKKVQDLQTSQARWFASIAHELRTPLTLICGPVRNIIRDQSLPESLVDELEMVKKNGEQLASRVNEILEVSRLESGKSVVNLQPEDLAVLARNVVDSFQPLAKQQRVALKFSYNVSPVLNIDAHKVTTILNNLLSNALKFTPSGGTVSIDWDFDQASDTSLDIKVSDTGIGIAEKDLPHIFERFYQVSHSQQTQSGGSGVGLALARELALLHGGLITVSSRENQGSTFVLSLPKNLIEEVGDFSASGSYAMEHTYEPDIVMSQKNERSNKPSILLVEDHSDMRHYICKCLGNDYQVIEAPDGRQALEIIREFTPDLIISDMMMPVMDGLNFARKLKEDPKHKLTPFIILTAHANERDKLMAYRTGVDDYMVKPFDAEELRVRIRNLLFNALERKKTIEESLALSDQVQAPTHEEELVKELEKLVKEHLSDSPFSISSLANHAAMSESSLRRLLKKMTGLSPGQFIRDIRLQEAIFFLESHRYKTISEVVYAVGFEDTSSFTRLFKKRFGKSPTAYLETISKRNVGRNITSAGFDND